MFIGGLQNFALPSLTPKASAVKDGSSFEETLGQQNIASDELGDATEVVETLENPGTIATPVPFTPTPSFPLSFKGTSNIASEAFGLKSTTATDVEEQGVDSLTRRAVWNDFLKKMKEELGVSAEDVLSAFSSLSPEDLAKPPAETVDQVVMALGLNDQQALIAKQHFQELIEKTKTKSLAPEIDSSNKPISLTIMSEREVSRRNLERSLDKMNQNFFLKGQYSQPTAPTKEAPLPIKAEAQTLPSASPRAVPSEEANASVIHQPTEGPLQNPAAKNVVNPLNEPNLAPKVSPSGAKFSAATKKLATDQSNSTMQTINDLQPAAKPMAAPKISAPQTAAASASLLDMSTGALQGPVVTKSATSSMRAPLNALEGLLSKLKDVGAGEDSDDSASMSDASFLNFPMAESAGKLAAPVLNGNDFQAQLAQVKPGQSVSVPDLIQNAQVMVRDGGGEMKVTLHPDGLGEVAMKVSVDHGKVSVQMVTESDEAKRLIEHQLGELKSQLSSNHLQLNEIKIDTATNLGKQMDQQYQDAQKHSTQMAWEQFRNDSQGWKRSFFETPSASVYRGQGSAQRDVQNPTMSSRSRTHGNRRLDLVA